MNIICGTCSFFDEWQDEEQGTCNGSSVFRHQTVQYYDDVCATGGCHSSFKRNSHTGDRTRHPTEVNGELYKSKAAAIRELHSQGSLSNIEIAEICQCSESNVYLTIKKVKEKENAPA